MRNLALFVVVLALAAGAYVLFTGDDDHARGASPAATEVTETTSPPAPRALEAAEASTSESERSAESSSRTPAVAPPSTPPPAPDTEATRVVGRCVAPGGTPVAGVRVSARGAGTSSDGAGLFALAFELDRPDFVDVAFVRENHADRTVEIEAARGRTVDLGDVVLEGAATVLGRVVDAAGTPVEGAEVQLEEALSVVHGSRFSGVDDPFRTTTTNADGRFRLERVAPGPLRVWAGAPDYSWSRSDPHDLQVGEEHEVRLELVPLEDEDVIELLVVDPDGAPVPHAPIQSRYRISGMSGSSSTSADEDGRLRVYCDPRAPRSFVAEHPEGHFGAALADDVPPGTRDLVLRLTPLRSFVLEVTSRTGGPVETYTARLEPEEESRDAISATSRAETRRDGRTEVATPPFPFTVVVEAPGFAIARVGPFAPENVPGTVFAELTSLPAVTGRVTAGGAPVRGATVTLHPARGERQVLEINSFPCRSRRSSVASVATDEDGSYRATVRTAGEYYVRAAADGYATTDAGPYSIDPALGSSGLDVVLGPGGTIAGRVLVHPGQPKVDWIVGASRGDGFATTTRTDHEGAFRFEGLAAGRWHVAQRDEEITPGRTSSGSWTDDDPADVPFNCRVTDGATTSFELDLRGLEACVVVGRLLLDGTPPPGGAAWTASLIPVEGERDEDDSATLDSEGRFRLAVPRGGPHVLMVEGDRGGARTTFREELQLGAGETTWEHDLATGRVEGTAPASALARRHGVHVLWSDGALSYEATVTPYEDGSFAVAGVPAGTVTVDGGGPEAQAGEQTVTVPEGGAATVDLR